MSPQEEKFNEQVDALRQHLELIDEGNPEIEGVLTAISALIDLAKQAHAEAITAQMQINTLAMFLPS